jgi:hypothetical protein
LPIPGISVIFRAGFRRMSTALREGGCRFPENLRVEVDAVAGLPQPGIAWLFVEVASQAPARQAAGRLVVREGAANVGELRLEKERTNLGRVVDVYRATGPSRRNDLAFAAETEVNATVSREHAHILFERSTGEYRLFNDRWYQRGPRPGECGLWIVRDGMSHEVHRNSRGAKLEPGDEIHLGRAILTFERD